MEKYLGIPGILCRYWDSVYIVHIMHVSMYATVYPLWKSISGYPGYCAGPRIVPGLSVYSVYYACEYVCRTGTVSRVS
jgi:hypothetical protein